MNLPLAHCRVLYTRAAAHWHKAQAVLQQLGADVRHLPLLDTRPLPFSLPFAPDVALFTSANAVQHFLAQSALPCASVAIGEATAQALIEQGHAPILTAPPPYDSEALLSVWQPKNQRIIIIAAPAGRSLLREQLSPHNSVAIIHAYERYCPSTQLLCDDATYPHAILAGSVSTLHHLVKIAEPNTLKLLQWRSCVVAFSPRIAEQALQLGFHRAISANLATETAQFQVLCDWWKSNKES